MEKLKHRVRQIGIDGIVVAILCIAAIVASIYDFFGSGNISSPVLVSALALLLLEAVLQRVRQQETEERISHLLSEMRVDAKHVELLARIQSLSQASEGAAHHIIEALGGTEAKVFESASSCLGYVNQRLQEASMQVDELSWNPVVVKGDALEETRTESRQLWKLTREVASRIPYREVYIFNRPHRLGKLRGYIEENIPGYSCGYYRGSVVPLLQFMIIDKEEAIFLTGKESYSAIRNRPVVQLLQQYFEDVWEGSIKLKEAGRIYTERIERILEEPNP